MNKTTNSWTIHLASPNLDDEMKNAAMSALNNERYVLGESVHRFEEEFARYCGTDFAVSTSSGTAALFLSLMGLRVSGSVITVPMSFVATANAIVQAGLAPKFVDVKREDYTIDISKVKSSLRKLTKAVIPVHLYGFPSLMDELRTLTAKRAVKIIEDACQAHGATCAGRRVGSIGDAGCFSFYPSKNMTVAGDGGMVVTNDEALASRIYSMRDAGRRKGQKYIHDVIGYTERMNSVQAAIGRIQLKRLDSWNVRRSEIATEYDRMLEDLRQIITPPKGDEQRQPVYHLYVIQCKQRDKLRKWLSSRGIETGIHYPRPIHLQPIYREMFGYKKGDFPISERLCSAVLSLPMHPQLTIDEIKFVSDSIHEFYGRRPR